MASNYPPLDASHHRRAKSSVLKSFIHKRTTSNGTALPSPTDDAAATSRANGTNQGMAFLPPDHPHSRALGELQQNQQTQTPLSPKKSREGKRLNTCDDGFKSLHKKTLSSISLKSLSGKDDDKSTKLKEPKEKTPKKTKSSTNLASLLSRPKSSKSLHKDAADQEARAQKDKENRSPVTPTDAALRPPPIYAQFSSEYFAKQPLGGKFLEDEIDLYTPKNYSPSKQRNFFEGPNTQPTLTKRDDRVQGQRPKSTYLPSSFSIQDISRRISGGSSRNSADIQRRSFGGQRPSFDRKRTDNSTKSDNAAANRGQRAAVTVSAFSGKSKHSETTSECILEDGDVDQEFEAMLDRRNIPEHQRGKMRSLALSMKKDFIRQDWAEIAAAKNGRPGTNSSGSSADAAVVPEDTPEVKSKRPRSRTFTLSRASSKESPSPTKKKAEASLGLYSRKNSSDRIASGSKSLTATTAGVAQILIAKAKGQTPDDFVLYLRKVPKPQAVEVGRLHKLRLLLRNEMVAWTDEFIRQGGMEEIVGLLHRTMEVEWR